MNSVGWNLSSAASCVVAQRLEGRAELGLHLVKDFSRCIHDDCDGTVGTNCENDEHAVWPTTHVVVPLVTTSVEFADLANLKIQHALDLGGR